MSVDSTGVEWINLDGAVNARVIVPGVLLARNKGHALIKPEPAAVPRGLDFWATFPQWENGEAVAVATTTS